MHMIPANIHEITKGLLVFITAGTMASVTIILSIVNGKIEAENGYLYLCLTVFVTSICCAALFLLCKNNG